MAKVARGLTREQIARAGDNARVAELALQLAAFTLAKIPLAFDEEGKTLFRAIDRTSSALDALRDAQAAIYATATEVT